MHTLTQANAVGLMFLAAAALMLAGLMRDWIPDELRRAAKGAALLAVVAWGAVAAWDRLPWFSWPVRSVEAPARAAAPVAEPVAVKAPRAAKAVAPARPAVTVREATVEDFARAEDLARAGDLARVERIQVQGPPAAGETPAAQAEPEESTVPEKRRKNWLRSVGRALHVTGNGK